jgi:hypothetical protein
MVTKTSNTRVFNRSIVEKSVQISSKAYDPKQKVSMTIRKTVFLGKIEK